jgi:hypothetical protein
MSDLFSNYFGPLDKSSCVYFLLISGIFFVLLVIAIVADVYWIVKNYKQFNLRILTGGVAMLFNLFLAYFVNRLLYTMCNKSLA